MLYALITLIALAYIRVITLRRKSAAPMVSDVFRRPYAHRGLYGKGVPENSLAAFRLAVKQGLGIELDVRITKDHHPVVFHDKSALRMCGKDMAIESMTLSQVRALRLLGTDEGIPMLSDVLGCVSDRVPVMIELKTPGEADMRTPYILRVADALKVCGENVCIVSFDPRMLHLMKKHAPHIPRGQLVTCGMSMLSALLLAPLLHLYARPHFLSCQVGTGRLFLKIARLFHSVLCGWTVRSMTEWQAVKHIFDLMVFEAFVPQADINARPIQKEGNLS